MQQSTYWQSACLCVCVCVGGGGGGGGVLKVEYSYTCMVMAQFICVEPLPCCSIRRRRMQ